MCPSGKALNNLSCLPAGRMRIPWKTDPVRGVPESLFGLSLRSGAAPTDEPPGIIASATIPLTDQSAVTYRGQPQRRSVPAFCKAQTSARLCRNCKSIPAASKPAPALIQTRAGILLRASSDTTVYFASFFRNVLSACPQNMHLYGWKLSPPRRHRNSRPLPLTAAKMRLSPETVRPRAYSGAARSDRSASLREASPFVPSRRSPPPARGGLLLLRSFARSTCILPPGRPTAKARDLSRFK